MPPSASMVARVAAWTSVCVRHVDRHVMDSAASRQLRGDGRYQRRVAIPERDGGTRVQQPLGNRAADALAAAGDDRTLTFQVDLIHGGS